jgi:hypothetical protein
MKYLLFDISNLLYRSFFVERQETDETLAGLATHSALVMLNKYYKQHKPDKVVMAFDRSSWRKEYTASDKCVSKKPYKGNRRKDMTPTQQAKYQRFLNHINEFEKMIADHTTIITLLQPRLEADDLIGGFCQAHSKIPEDEVVLISTDTDMLQLLKYKNVRIISPDKDKEQKLDDYNNDPEYYVFSKCVRGDPTDNVQSAFPRVRSTRIEKAYNDPFERVQLMQERWTNEDKIEFLVADLFKENELLINLEKQPEDIRALIETGVAEAEAKEREFSLFFILRFIGKYKLVKIKESIDQYIPLLSK